MLRRVLLASAALLALGGGANAQQSRQPGFNRNTFQLAGFSMLQLGGGSGAGGGGASTPASAGCRATGGYQGYGDCIPSGVTVQRFFGLRAFSYASAQAGQYLARIYGDGATGDAATTVYADVRAKADGTPDFVNAVYSDGTIGPITPGAGTASKNPCYANAVTTAAGDGKCRVGALYDGTTQTATAATSGAIANNNTVANRPVLYQNIQNNAIVTSIPSANIRSGLQLSGSQSLQDTSLTAVLTQPFLLGAVAARASGNTTAYGIVGYGTKSYIRTNTNVNEWVISNGTGIAFAVPDGSPSNFDVAFNAAASSSLVQVNGSLLTSTANPGSLQAGGTLYLGQSASSATLSGVGFEWAYTTGAGWNATTLGYVASNRSSYYSLGF